MGSILQTETENNLKFQSGEIFNAILNIMSNLKVEKNGKKLDKETGEVLYNFIQIDDLRSALNPLLRENKCIIRKISSKQFRDRKQNKFGTWMNIDIVENTYMIQSLKDGSYIIGTGRGEGTDWGDSACTLSEADAYKNFLGITFCLVTDTEVETVDEPSEEKPKRKRRKKEEVTIPSERSSEQLSALSQVDTVSNAPEPKEESAEEVESTEAEEVKEATEEAEASEDAEEKEKEETNESAEKTPELDKEKTPEEIIKDAADIICPVKGEKTVAGKSFGEILDMALNNSEQSEICRKLLCTVVASPHLPVWKDQSQFINACKAAVELYGIAV